MIFMAAISSCSAYRRHSLCLASLIRAFELWFDTQDKWLTRTSARGPQVITGMRGCGKTMLLRALHFHARTTEAQKRGGNISNQLERDHFLGLYASCQKLLDPYRRPEG